MLNRIVITGRCVSAPELRRAGELDVANVRIACDRDFKNKETGEREADFINIVAWRGAATFLANNFDKGSLLTVDGRLQSRNYEDKEGNKRTAFDVVAENIYFGSSKPTGDAPAEAPKKAATKKAEPAQDTDDSDPF